MNIKGNMSNNKSYEKSEFVQELIYENIDLMTENIKLSYENKKLKRRLLELENASKAFPANSLMKEGEGCVVILVGKDREGYEN